MSRCSVTGGASGIGLGVATSSRVRHHVAVLDRNGPAAEVAAGELRTGALRRSLSR